MNRLDFVWGGARASFPEQQLVIEPTDERRIRMAKKVLRVTFYKYYG